MHNVHVILSGSAQWLVARQVVVAAVGVAALHCTANAARVRLENGAL